MKHLIEAGRIPRSVLVWLLAAGLVYGPVSVASADRANRARPEPSLAPPSGPHSFREIAAAVTKETPGRILRIRLVRRTGRLIYLVRVLRPDNKRRDITLDGATLVLVEK